MKPRLLVLLALLLSVPLQAQLVPVTADSRVDAGEGRNPVLVDVSMDADGSYLVAWVYYQNPGTFSCDPSEPIYGRRFDAGGRPLGAPFVAVTLNGWCVEQLKIGPPVGGRRLVVWQQAGGNLGPKQWVVAALGASGRAKVLREMSGANILALIPLRSGGLLETTWNPRMKKSALWGRRLDASARPLAPSFLIAREPGGLYSVDAVETTGRNLAVSWASTAPGDLGPTVLSARTMRADGTPRGPVFQVTAQPEYEMRYRIAGGADGRFIFVWTTFDITETDHHPVIRAAQYLADGSPLTPLLNLTPPSHGYRYLQDLALDANGEFVPVWQVSDDGDWDDNGAELVDASGYVYDVKEPLAENPEGKQRQSAVSTDSSGLWVVAWAGDGPEGPGIYTRLFTSRP